MGLHNDAAKFIRGSFLRGGRPVGLGEGCAIIPVLT